MFESNERAHLRRLADRLGVMSSYMDQTGEQERITSDDTRVKLLAAMGVDASTEEKALRALRGMRRKQLQQWLAPVRVVRQRSRGMRRVAARVPTTREDEVRWTLTLRTEEGMESSWSGFVHGGRTRRVSLDLPVRPPLGYHQLTLEWHAGGRTRSATQQLIVVPSQCTAPETRLQGQRGFGLIANLYTVRSEENWGAGDTGDLARLATWVGQHGGAFVGMNPLHTLRNEGYDVSPYSPITRLFRNPLYLRVHDIPELAHDSQAQALIASREFQEALEELRAATTLDYARVMALRTPVLESLHSTFARRGDGHRDRAYARYVEREDPALTRYATFMAISEREGPDARAWPAELQDPSGEAVASLGRELGERVDYHRWLQFELDRQLARAASEAAKAGLALGLYQDLAVGSSASGADVWSNMSLFVQGATVGAPPDMYSDEGQNWGLPAINPHVLRETGYDYWIRLLRAQFRHSGALRIDHALGLFRMFWVPVGESARGGAFVKSFSEDLFGIIALESVRHGALVVGEDLGTVPPEVPGVLARWGVLSSKLLVFERDFHSGRFRAAKDYPRMALATVNTHDLPPLVGWLEQRDIAIRSEVGDLADPDTAASMRNSRRSDSDALIASLIETGLLPHDAHHRMTAEEIIEAVHSFVRRTPSALVGLSLDDIALESAPVNIPGVWQDKYASWSRRMGITLERLFADPRSSKALGAP